MKILMLLPLLLAACVRPVAPVVQEGGPGTQPKRKELAGEVTFTGLSESELREIRVIPERGKQVFIPENRRYDQVDGLWWSGDRSRWLKIPDHGEVWIGGRPKIFDGETKLGDLRVFYRSQPFWAVANVMRGGVRRPGWVPDEGRTKSPVDWPW